MEKKREIKKITEDFGKKIAKHQELSLWWSNYKMFMNKGDIAELFKLLDILVLNANYVRNRKNKDYGSEYYNVVVHVLKMANKPVNELLSKLNKE